MINELVNTHNIVFVIEHWLAREEACIVKQTLHTTHNLVYMSSFSLAEVRQGRPYGGLMWLVDSRYSIVAHAQLDERISVLTLSLGGSSIVREKDTATSDSGGSTHNTHSSNKGIIDGGNISTHNNNKHESSSTSESELVVIGVWLHYDDGSPQALYEHRHSLEQLNQVIIDCKRRHHAYILVGDWNCDIDRQRRFDDMFRDFICQNSLLAATDVHKLTTYIKGSYSARIDHILVPSELYHLIRHYEVINNARNISDHRPLSIAINGVQKRQDTMASLPSDDTPRAAHHFNWKCGDFVK